MKADPIYQIGIFGLNPKKKLHEYKSYDLPVEKMGLTFIRENGSVEKVTGDIKKVEVSDAFKENGAPIPVKVFIDVARRSPVLGSKE